MRDIIVAIEGHRALNSSTTTNDVCWIMGFQAFKAGIDRMACPFQSPEFLSRMLSSWLAGWDTAKEATQKF